MSKFIILDTETTGIESEDRIVQLAFMVLGRIKEPVEVFNEFCKPPLDIKIEAMEVHGITPDMISNKPSCIELSSYKELMKLNHNENYIIIHNAKFDLDMLKKEGFINNMQIIDTLRCAKHLFPNSKAFRLQYFKYEMKLYEEEKIEAQKHNIITKAHDAISDVLVLKLFVSKLVATITEKFGKINVMNKLVQLTNTPVTLTTFNFGKYKNRLIADIVHEDLGYITWMQKDMELDEDMSYTLKKLQS